MENKTIKKWVNSALAWSIIASICFVVGIPGIIISAIYFTPTLAASIVMVVFGFYGSPMLWLSFANRKSAYEIYTLIVSGNISSIKMLCQQSGKEEKEVKDTLQLLMRKGFLTNFQLTEENQIVTVNQKKSTMQKSKCPNCGASLTVKNGKTFCQYCGTEFDNN